MLSDHPSDSTWPHPPPPPPLRMYTSAQPSARPDDAQLCIDVRLALLRICPTLAYAVEITARQGVVQLRGSVSSERALVRMYKAARRVQGIDWICNDVVVTRPA